MWGTLEKIADQVVKYSTFLGQLWYILVFIFRLIVVVTLGEAVYGDEQSAFDCNTRSPGCKNTCFDKFTKLSHLRFWGFQLLAITFPIVLFHFFSLYITSRIAKIKLTKENIKQEENIKQKMIQIPTTFGISIAYYLTTILRSALEAVFIYLGYILYTFDNSFCNSSEQNLGDCNKSSVLKIIWGDVPAVYICYGHDNTAVAEACSQHFGDNFGREGGFVPCWISRSWEKTLFLRYMNILSVIGLILCISELLFIPGKAFWGMVTRRRRSYSKSLIRRHIRLDEIGHPQLIRKEDDAIKDNTSDYTKQEQVMDKDHPTTHHEYIESLSFPLPPPPPPPLPSPVSVNEQLMTQSEIIEAYPLPPPPPAAYDNPENYQCQLQSGSDPP